MALEKKIDLSSPFFAVVEKLKSALESVSGTTVDINVNPTPMQEIDASLERTKEGMGQTAATKLDPFSKPDKGPDDDYAQALKKIEVIGVRLGHLMEKIDAGKDITGNAAKEVEWLQTRLEKVAQAARDAAKALGNEELALQATAMEERAASGGMKAKGPGGEGGGGYTLPQLLGYATNPLGMAKQTATSVLGDLMAEGGLLAGTAGAVAAGAALAIGAGVAVYKLETKLANEAANDASKELADIQMSRNASSTFDFRHDFYDENRWSPATRTRLTGQHLNANEIRTFMRGMNVGVDNWHRPEGWNIDDSMAVTGMSTANYAARMGASTEQLASMIGASIRTGGVQAGDAEVKTYLSMIAGATIESAKQGVSTNEKLQTLATANQKSVAATGFLTSAAMKLNMQALGAFEATGDKALQGSLGIGAINGLAGTGDDESRAREIGFMMDNGKLRPEYQAMVDANPYLKQLQQEMGDAMAANALLDDPYVRAAVNQRGMRAMMGGGMTAFQAGRRMGVRTGTMSKDAVSIYGGMKAGDLQSYTNPALTDPLDDKDTAAGQARILALGAVWAGRNADDTRQTGYTYEAAKAMLEASQNLNAASNNFGKALSNSWMVGSEYQAYATPYNQSWGANPAQDSTYGRKR